MSEFSKIIQTSNDEVQAILDEFNITAKEFQENIEIINQWISQSSHLPGDKIDDNYIKVALLNNKMNIERTKQTIEGFFRIKTIFSDAIFDKTIPNTEDYEIAKKSSTVVVLPKLTPNLCRITIARVNDPDGLAPSAYYYYIITCMLTEIRLKNDFFLSNIVIADLELTGLKTILKYTPSVTNAILEILKAVNLRIHSIHLINLPEYSDNVIKLLKIVLPGNIFGKIHVHKTVESLHKHISPEYLPSNYGGTLESIEETYERICDVMEKSEDFFIEQQKMKSTKKYELDEYQKELFGIGMEGTFKQLAID